MPEAEEAEELFVLMTGRYRLSRNTRAQWFFNHINRIASCSTKERMVSLYLLLLCVILYFYLIVIQEEFTEEIEIVSMLPSNYQHLVEEEAECGPFLITQNTKVTFLARRYRLAFILDLSPSMTTVVSEIPFLLISQVNVHPPVR